MATYSRHDFERIATAIDESAAKVELHEKEFEAAALWYRLSRNASRDKSSRDNASNNRMGRRPKDKRTTPFAMHKRLTQIANAARKLLKHLEITDPAQAMDGPTIDILEALASAKEGSEDAIIGATARIGRLVEIVEAAEAAQELERIARKATEDVKQLGELTVLKGHHGEAAANDWIAAMMSIYKKITGEEPGTSVGAPARENKGVAGGPVIRFLEAAGKPIGVEYSPDAWRNRIRLTLKGAPQQN